VDYTTKQMYLPDTAVLITRFITEAGVGEVVDFMPPTSDQATDNHRIVRMIRCVRGEMSFEIDIAPRFDYGREAHTLEMTEHGAAFATDSLTLTVHPVREETDERLSHVRIDEGDLRVSIRLTAGQLRGVVLESSADVHRGRSGWRSSSGCTTRRSASGAHGSPGPPMSGVGGRRCSARRSRSS
jgi:GH15 family glucan-1,4-alpha-glucosidase